MNLFYLHTTFEQIRFMEALHSDDGEKVINEKEYNDGGHQSRVQDDGRTKDIPEISKTLTTRFHVLLVLISFLPKSFLHPEKRQQPQRPQDDDVKQWDVNLLQNQGEDSQQSD